MKKQTQRQCTATLGIAINVIGAFVAMSLRLPIYLDSIGTVLVSALLGSFYGMAAGLLGGLLSGMTFDIYSLYYAPAQALTGLMVGMLFHSSWLKGKKLPIGVWFISLPTTIVSAVITACLFGGVTSSGSSIIVLLLSKLGIPLTVSVVIVQFLTDYGDEFFAVVLVTVVLRAMSYEMKLRLQGE